MPKIFTSPTQKIGEIAENLAVKFLVKQGFSITERNYTEKWGEIDIIAEKDQKIYFIEVKSIQCDLFTKNYSSTVVTRETFDNYRPEENMHPQKLKRMGRTIQTYLLLNNLEEKDWQIDLLIVYLSLKNKKVKIKVESDIIL